MIRLGISLQRSEIPKLCLEDLANIKRRYPQLRRDGTLNYAFIGGGGLGLLLDAEYVEGSSIQDEGVKDGRTHKDLEVYAFTPCFGRKNPNPHDLCGITNFGPLVKFNYTKHPPNAGIIVEILRGCYFGNIFPTKEDTRQVTLNHKTYWTLSPEFFIATALMNPAGIREGIDDKDAERLLKKFTLDQTYLERIVARSHFHDVVHADELSVLAQNMKSGTYFKKVQERIKEKYRGVIPFVDALDYNAAANLLQFTPEDLGDFLDSFTKEFFLRTADQENPIYALCLHYFLQHINRNYNTSKALDYLIKYDLKNILSEDTHQALRRTAGINKILSILRQVQNPSCDYIYDPSSLAISHDLWHTHYFHVKLEGYYKTFTDALHNGTPLSQDPRKITEVVK